MPDRCHAAGSFKPGDICKLAQESGGCDADAADAAGAVVTSVRRRFSSPVPCPDIERNTVYAWVLGVSEKYSHEMGWTIALGYTDHAWYLRVSRLRSVKLQHQHSSRQHGKLQP